MACNLPSHDHRPTPLQSQTHTATKLTCVVMHHHKAAQPVTAYNYLACPTTCFPHNSEDFLKKIKDSNARERERDSKRVKDWNDLDKCH